MVKPEDIERMERQLQGYREARERGCSVGPVRLTAGATSKQPAPKPQFTRMIHEKLVRITVIPDALGPVVDENTYAGALLKLEMMKPDCVTRMMVRFQNLVRIEPDNFTVQVRRDRRAEMISPDLFLFFHPIKGAKALFRLWGATLSPQDK